MRPWVRLLRRAARALPEETRARLKTALGVPTMEGGLRRMRRNGFLPQVVLDVGAYAGEWTRLCKRIYPAARVLMIEPQEARGEDLRRVCVSCDGVELASALVGAREIDSVPFYEAETASSVLAEAEKRVAPSAAHPMTTLDRLTEGTPFSRPNLIKLDVQGYELQVLAGADGVLAAAEAVLMEVNLIGIYRDAPLLDEAVAFMSARDFRVYDICGFFRRPYDGALWQIDAIFVRGSSSLLASKRWS